MFSFTRSRPFFNQPQALLEPPSDSKFAQSSVDVLYLYIIIFLFAFLGAWLDFLDTQCVNDVCSYQKKFKLFPAIYITGLFSYFMNIYSAFFSRSLRLSCFVLDTYIYSDAIFVINRELKILQKLRIWDQAIRSLRIPLADYSALKREGFAILTFFWNYVFGGMYSRVWLITLVSLKGF